MSVAVAVASPIPSAQGTPATSGAVPEKHSGVPLIPRHSRCPQGPLFRRRSVLATSGSNTSPRQPEKSPPPSPRKNPYLLACAPQGGAHRARLPPGSGILQPSPPTASGRPPAALRGSVRAAARARPLHGNLWSHRQPTRPPGDPGVRIPHRTPCLHRAKGRAMRHPRRTGTRSRDGHKARPPAPVIPQEHAHAAPKAGIPP